MDRKKMYQALIKPVLGLNQRLKNMKKPNSKFKVELVKSNNDSPYVVIENETNTIISRHTTREKAQEVMNFQVKTILKK